MKLQPGRMFYRRRRERAMAYGYGKNVDQILTHRGKDAIAILQRAAFLWKVCRLGTYQECLALAEIAFVARPENE